MNKPLTGTPTILVWILLIMGSIFFLLGLVPYYMWQEKNNLLKNGIKTEGVISDMIVSGSSSKGSSSYNPIIKYKDETGTMYSFKSGFYSSSMHIGDKIDVYYYKNHPERAELSIPDYLIAIFLIFPLLGALFLFFGIRILIKEQKKAKRYANLLQHGQVIKAEVTEVYQNTGLKINGRSPYVVECCYTDNHGEKYLYKSENLYFNPLPYIEDNSVKIYLHPQDKATYYVAIQESAKQVHDFR